MVKDLINSEECQQLKKSVEQLIDQWDPERDSSCIFSTGGNREQSRSRYFLESGDKISFFMEEDAFDPETREIHSECLVFNHNLICSCRETQSRQTS